MIVDRRTQLTHYLGLQPHLDRAFEYLRDTDFGPLADGRYDIQGDNLYALVQSYETQGAEGRDFEAHQRYIDIQYVHAGRECIYYCHRDELRQVTDYDADKDFSSYAGDGIPLHLKAGDFTLFFPHDAHMPACIWKISELVKKVVIKVRTS